MSVLYPSDKILSARRRVWPDRGLQGQFELSGSGFARCRIAACGVNNAIRFGLQQVTWSVR
jgi:hypothetical protein